MKKLLLIVALNFILARCYALGPNEISFNGEKFYKYNEKYQNNAIIAEYESTNRQSSNSIVLTHVLNKSDPSKIAQGLKTKKSIEVVDLENLKEDNSDVLVSFIKFDAPNLKVQNNLCRIIRNDKGGCFVFQYVDTKRMKSQSEGATLPDFTQLSEHMKQTRVEKYVNGSPSSFARSERHMWYKRHNARMGRRGYDGYYRGYEGYHRRAAYPYRY